jgi:hypothetical protein
MISSSAFQRFFIALSIITPAIDLCMEKNELPAHLQMGKLDRQIFRYALNEAEDIPNQIKVIRDKIKSVLQAAQHPLCKEIPIPRTDDVRFYKIPQLLAVTTYFDVNKKSTDALTETICEKIAQIDAQNNKSKSTGKELARYCIYDDNNVNIDTCTRYFFEDLGHGHIIIRCVSKLYDPTAIEEVIAEIER